MKKFIILGSLIIISIIVIFIWNIYKDLDNMVSMNNKISEYFINGGNYDNLCYHYLDKDKATIVVGLKDDSKEEIKKFKKTILNYRFITFEKCVDNINYSSYVFDEAEFDYNNLGNINGMGIYSKYKVNKYNNNNLIDVLKDKGIDDLLSTMDKFKDNYYISDAYENGRVFISICNNNIYISNEFDSEICN